MDVWLTTPHCKNLTYYKIEEKTSDFADLLYTEYVFVVLMKSQYFYIGKMCFFPAVNILN